MMIRCCPEVAWSVELYGVMLIHRDSGRSIFLGYPEAAVWEMCARGYGFERIRRLIGPIADLSPKQVDGFLDDTFRDWAESGFITIEAPLD